MNLNCWPVPACRVSARDTGESDTALQAAISRAVRYGFGSEGRLEWAALFQVASYDAVRILRLCQEKIKNVRRRAGGHNLGKQTPNTHPIRKIRIALFIWYHLTQQRMRCLNQIHRLMLCRKKCIETSKALLNQIDFAGFESFI